MVVCRFHLPILIFLFSTVIFKAPILNAAILMAATHKATAAKAAPDPSAQVHCDPDAIANLLKKYLPIQWNTGRARAWDQEGAFLAAPTTHTPKDIEIALKHKDFSHCNIVIASLASFSVRITPKATYQSKEENQPKATDQPNEKDQKSFISPLGSTMGFFSPGPGESMIMIYPAKIASAIARGAGQSQINGFTNITSKFQHELDIEYNFGDVQIQIFGGIGRLTMRESIDASLSDLQKRGYKPIKGSEADVQKLDGYFPPDTHESFWANQNGVLRLDLSKHKQGQVRINLHETRQTDRQ
jgi:hypothetical protein